MKKEQKMPDEVARVVEKLQQEGHEAYIVGGCVRDILRGTQPKDWDITTSAKPEEILKLFPESFYENKFFTVVIKTDPEGEISKGIEVTTFRAEGKYTDKRHPDEVRFAKTLEEDLSRRDFTVNAMALSLRDFGRFEEFPELKIGRNPQSEHYFVQRKGLIDPFNGAEDLKNKIIRAVGNPEERFDEDALRMMRAARLAVQFGFAVEEKTRRAIQEFSGNLAFIAKERIRDEYVKIIETPRARDGIELLHELGLLKHVIPELEEGIGVENRPKIFTVWEHNLKALEYGAKVKYPLDVLIAALLHDAGKPRTKGPKKNDEWTFYGHDVVGSRMAAGILERLHFPRETVEKIATLIRWHLFKYDPDEGITDSSIRRLIRHVGAENMNDLVKLRICDRMGMGVPKALPYRLRHFQFRVEKILREEETPTPKMLKVNGNDIMNILEISPGVTVGHILEVLLQEVIDNPSLNVREMLETRVRELGELSDGELVKIADSAESKIELAEDERISGIKSKYYVK